MPFPIECYTGCDFCVIYLLWYKYNIDIISKKNIKLPKILILMKCCDWLLGYDSVKFDPESWQKITTSIMSQNLLILSIMCLNGVLIIGRIYRKYYVDRPLKMTICANYGNVRL